MLILFFLACIPDDVCLQDTSSLDSGTDTALADSDVPEDVSAHFTVTCEHPPTHDVTINAGATMTKDVAVWAHTSEWGWSYMVVTGVEPAPWIPVEPRVTSAGGVTVTCDYVYPIDDPNGIGGFIQDYFMISVW